MHQQGFRWLTLIAGVFITSLIISNIIAVKMISVWRLILPAGVILFPITYIFGDVLTEVYGYARARQVIWLGFFCNLLAVIAIWIAGILPAAEFWRAGVFENPKSAQDAYRAILGFTPRLLVASFIAYLFGEFINSYVLAKLKVRTKGRFLWMRTIGSTVVGQGADSAIFIMIAFYGIFPLNAIGVSILSQWGFKVAYEAAATPLTYLVVNKLKRLENIDYLDTDTAFNPIIFK